MLNLSTVFDVIQKLIKDGLSLLAPPAIMNQTSKNTTSLTLQRKVKNSIVSIGELSINEQFECYTLEGIAVEIPVGTYPVEITFSQHFNRLLPLIDNVPSRSGIRIHPGNTVQDTEGCILVGTSHDAYDVYNSKEAFDNLFAKLQSAESIQITII